MRILIVHTYYQSPGGEDVVFHQEADLLAKTATVERLSFHNRTSWRGFIQTALSIWNFYAGAKLRKAIRKHRPDIIHLHNLHYAIGPIAIRIAKRAGIPVVMSLHNYRLLCPSANLLYQGKPFTESINAPFPWKAVALGLHSHSIIKTFWLAWVNWFHRKISTWAMVDRYIVLTDFAKDLFIHSSFGIPANKFVVKPNFSNTPVQVKHAKRKSFLFLGRLSEEKGVRILLRAFESNGLPLLIVGDGPLKEEVLDSCKVNPAISYLGPLPYEKAQEVLRQSFALVFPSVCYEGMPLTIIEAFANATPVIASNHGAMISMVEPGKNGLLFRAGDPDDLNEKLRYWSALDEKMHDSYYRQAQASYQALYTPEKNKNRLLGIYQHVAGKS